MKRIKELLSVKNDDNKIEIEAEIYNILIWSGLLTVNYFKFEIIKIIRSVKVGFLL